MNGFLKCGAAAAIGLAGFGLAGGAHAGGGVPGPATSSAECTSNTGPVSDVGGTTSCSLIGATSTLVLAPFVNLQTKVSDAAGVSTQDAFATLNYDFVVTGGSLGDTVTVGITTNLATFADPSTDAFAEFDYGPGLQEQVCIGEGETCAASSFNGTLSYVATVGQLQHIEIFIGAENTFAKGGAASASADRSSSPAA